MTRKEILQVIEANPKRSLYLRYKAEFPGIGEIGFHHPTSKTRLLRCAKFIHTVRVSTFLEERKDLNPNRYTDADIVTFEATFLQNTEKKQ